MIQEEKVIVQMVQEEKVTVQMVGN